MAKVCRSLIFLHDHWLTVEQAELRVDPVNGNRNPKPTATMVVHLAPSDVKANAELALKNLVGDIPQGPLSASTQEEDVISKADRLSAAGKNAIKKTDAFKDAIPAIDNFVSAIDTIAHVRTFNLR